MGVQACFNPFLVSVHPCSKLYHCSLPSQFSAYAGLIQSTQPSLVPSSSSSTSPHIHLPSIKYIFRNIHCGDQVRARSIQRKDPTTGHIPSHTARLRRCRDSHPRALRSLILLWATCLYFPLSNDFFLCLLPFLSSAFVPANTTKKSWCVVSIVPSPRNKTRDGTVFLCYILTSFCDVGGWNTTFN